MPAQSKLLGVVACGAAAYGVSQAFTSVSTPPQGAGHGAGGATAAHGVLGSVPFTHPVCTKVCAISGVALAAGASQAASKRRARVRVTALGNDEELAFQPGQQVTLLAPEAMKGKQGTIVEPDAGDTFRVQLESGSIFSFPLASICSGQSAPAAAPVAAASPSAAAADDEDLAFQPGERVTLLAPPAMAGTQATVVGPALGGTFAVQLDSGSIFNIAEQNVSGGNAPARAAAQAAAAPVASSAPAATAQNDDELEFQPGERVTLLAPPAMAGTQATVVGPSLGDTFAVQLASGSVFNIATENLQGSSGGRATAAPAAAAASVAAAQDDDELEFQPGERITLLAPPAVAGKQGTIVGPALGETFAVQFDSGSVFNIATANIQGSSGGIAPAAAAPVTSFAPTAAAQDGGELEFQPGQQVTLLAPPAMTGKQCTIIGPALDNTFKVQLVSGSIFHIPTENIQDAALSAPVAAAQAPPATAAAPVASAGPSEDEEFEKGQLVEILAPPALAGKQGTIGGPTLDDCWMVVLASGSIFNIKTQNLRARVTV